MEGLTRIKKRVADLRAGSLANLVTDLIFPRRCPVCDEAVKPFGSLICSGCPEKIKYIRKTACLKCGKQIPGAADEYCSDCTLRDHLYDRGAALYDYKTMSDSIYRFKYKGRREYADFYARELADHLGSQIRRWQPDALIPVPIHRDRLVSRGYNQAAVLAKELSGILNIPTEDKLVIRQRKTAPQKDLNGPERQKNLKKAFKICKNDVKLNTIVIIDDIYTTGSTIDSLTAELKRSGVKKVYFIALAIGQGI